MRSLTVVRGLLFGSGFLVLAYVASHLLGLRGTTGLLCRVDLQAAPHASDVIGLVVYLASYVGAILVAPVLLLSAGMMWLHDKMRARRPRGSKADPPLSADT